MRSGEQVPIGKVIPCSRHTNSNEKTLPLQRRPRTSSDTIATDDKDAACAWMQPTTQCQTLCQVALPTFSSKRYEINGDFVTAKGNPTLYSEDPFKIQHQQHFVNQSQNKEIRSASGLDDRLPRYSYKRGRCLKDTHCDYWHLPFAYFTTEVNVEQAPNVLSSFSVDMNERPVGDTIPVNEDNSNVQALRS